MQAERGKKREMLWVAYSFEFISTGRCRPSSSAFIPYIHLLNAALFTRLLATVFLCLARNSLTVVSLPYNKRKWQQTMSPFSSVNTRRRCCFVLWLPLYNDNIMHSQCQAPWMLKHAHSLAGVKSRQAFKRKTPVKHKKFAVADYFMSTPFLCHQGDDMFCYLPCKAHNMWITIHTLCVVQDGRSNKH